MGGAGAFVAQRAERGLRVGQLGRQWAHARFSRGLHLATVNGRPIRGNLVPDAALAALLRQHGVSVLYTADADFRRFGFLDVRNPFEDR